MKRTLTLVITAGLLLIGSLLLSNVQDKTSPHSDKQQPGDMTFTQPQRDAIGVIARDYLLAHPDILLQMSEKLDSQSQGNVAEQEERVKP